MAFCNSALPALAALALRACVSGPDPTDPADQTALQAAYEAQQRREALGNYADYACSLAEPERARELEKAKAAGWLLSCRPVPAP